MLHRGADTLLRGDHSEKTVPWESISSVAGGPCLLQFQPMQSLQLNSTAATSGAQASTAIWCPTAARPPGDMDTLVWPYPIPEVVLEAFGLAASKEEGSSCSSAQVNYLASAAGYTAPVSSSCCIFPGSASFGSEQAHLLASDLPQHAAYGLAAYPPVGAVVSATPVTAGLPCQAPAVSNACSLMPYAAIDNTSGAAVEASSAAADAVDASFFSTSPAQADLQLQLALCVKIGDQLHPLPATANPGSISSMGLAGPPLLFPTQGYQGHLLEMLEPVAAPNRFPGASGSEGLPVCGAIATRAQAGLLYTSSNMLMTDGMAQVPAMLPCGQLFGATLSSGTMLGADCSPTAAVSRVMQDVCTGASLPVQSMCHVQACAYPPGNQHQVMPAQQPAGLWMLGGQPPAAGPQAAGAPAGGSALAAAAAVGTPPSTLLPASAAARVGMLPVAQQQQQLVQPAPRAAPQQLQPRQGGGQSKGSAEGRIKGPQPTAGAKKGVTMCPPRWAKGKDWDPHAMVQAAAVKGTGVFIPGMTMACK